MQTSRTIIIKKILLGFFLIVSLFIWYQVFAENNNGLMTVAFLDIGQGDAIFIETPSGRQILLDAGPNKKVLQKLSEQMDFYDRSIDILIESHPDMDHIGGFPPVLNSYEVTSVFNSGVNCDKAICKEIEESISERGVDEDILTRGEILSLGDGVYLEVLFPDRNAINFETNMASLVLKLVYGETSFLLTGDSPKTVEKYLILLDENSSVDELDVDILKLGHHGSKTSTSNYFVGITSPEVAIISAGENNRYGHPHQEVLDILNNFGVKVLRTDKQGTIIIKSDGKNLIY